MSHLWALGLAVLPLDDEILRDVQRLGRLLQLDETVRRHGVVPQDRVKAVRHNIVNMTLSWRAFWLATFQWVTLPVNDLCLKLLSRQ